MSGATSDPLRVSALDSVPEIAMFPMMWNSAITETGLLDQVEDAVRGRLPRGWRVTVRRDVRAGPNRGDAQFRLTAPDGRTGVLLAGVKRDLPPKLVSSAVSQLRAYAGDRAGIIVASYLSPRSRELLIDNGISYADATGNLRIVLDSPALFILTDGADSDPGYEPRAIRSLKGPAAATVVRALCDFAPPYGVRELAERADLSLASTSRILSLLDAEAIVTRSRRGPVESVDWQRLLRRWVDDYGLTKSNRNQYVLEPRGLSGLTKKLSIPGLAYALTGSIAAVELAPVAPTRLGAVYVNDIAKAQRELGLREVETGANVVLVEPFSPVAMARTWQRDGLTYAAPAQVAADLLTSPGRGPAEGEALIEWMAQNEDAWRA